ncbi:GGDEF domain-containing phosphodiesterase [Thauera sp.]|jgi:EAL domain-containing protein (putative c-di-GMP-specific phosphodiesterase class I)|uniref:GGDEF domain-containing phosphodiesterase n=1 Tax=Thauera sp. TaxID=1905334 RepID=UPI002610C985|nr:GGDEF domain-containing phosphodiesterase [Thauera sp.]MCK6408941.1 EAL domain-containing protein [Thauera sp.]
MESLTPTGFLTALTEVSTRLVETRAGRLGVGVISLYAQADATLYRLPLEHLRRFERAVEQRIRAQLRRQDQLFAVDGKEWLIVLPGLASSAVLTLGMLRFEQLFNDGPLVVDGIELPIRIVCGGAFSLDHGDDAFHLLQSARIAGLVAGRGVSGSLIYEPSMERSAPKAALLEHDLRAAFAGGTELELWLQPKVHVATGACRSTEALLRWRNSAGELIPPPVVIGLIDRLGLRHRFNRWLFQRAAQILHILRLEGLEADLSINLSATDLYDAEVPDLIAQALSTWSVEAPRLCLEITETSMIDEAAGNNVPEVLYRLRQLGVSLSIDDFGTGFSGMSRLKWLAVQEVKIDRSFVTDLLTSARDREIAASIIDLSHRLGVEVTAEGVEDESTARLLAGMGCDHLQGFLFAPALPLDDFVAWVRKRMGVGVATAGQK